MVNEDVLRSLRHRLLDEDTKTVVESIQKSSTMSRSAVFSQPFLASTQNSIMPYPGAVNGISQGLEYLAAVDQLVVRQELALLEESDTCGLFLCGAVRSFVIHITDTQQQEVLNISRDLQCAGCCWFADNCCKQPITIKDKFGQKLGTVRMIKSCCQFRFGIFDERDELLYEIWAPCFACQCCCMTDDVIFPICNEKNKTQVGKISKIWSDNLRERLNIADSFNLLFPLDLNTKHKALMLGTVFLIDYFIFDANQSDKISTF